MKLPHLGLQIAVAMAALVAANLVVAQLAVNSVPRQLLRKGDAAEPATDLFLGNSTMAAGLDEEAFVAATPGRRALNLGLGATSPVEHYLLYRQQRKQSGSAVYYGFVDRQLTDTATGGWDSLVGNRALAYYVEPEVALQFLVKGSPLESCALRWVGRVPILVERYAIWAKVEMVRRFLGEIGMPPKETNRFGRADDFALLEEDRKDFARRCEEAAADLVPLSEPMAAIFQLAKERGSVVFVVEMPMPCRHRQRQYASAAWKAYRAHIMKLIHEAGGAYVAAADWIADEGFADSFHLNAAGAKEFSLRLAHWTRQDR